MRIEIVPNGKRAWTWLILNEQGYPLHYGWCYGKGRAQRRAERIAGRHIESMKYTYPESEAR